MSRRYHRDISVAAPRLPQYSLVRILGLTPQAMYPSPLRGSGSHDNFSSGLDKYPLRGRASLASCLLDLASGRDGGSGRVGGGFLTPVRWSGSTLLLRIPGSGPGGIAIAITPTIIRTTDFDPDQLAAIWVGTEMKIRAAR